MRPLLAILTLMTTLSSIPAFAEPTAAELFAQYTKSPDTHPNIPNCSYAGYRASDSPLPTPKVVANVRDFAAKGDGKTDDSAAFASALEAAAKAGGGAVLVPAGHYRIEKFLHLKYDNVVLRGESRATTTLEFINPLAKVVAPFPSGGKSGWSWSGGLVWIGPADTFDAAGKLANNIPSAGQPAWEYFRPGKKLAAVQSKNAAGEKILTLDAAPNLKPGDYVLLAWQNPADASLLKHIAGHPAMEKYNWPTATWILPPAYPQYTWPVQVAAVQGTRITLKQALRIDIRPEWKVAVHELGPVIREAGIAHFTLIFHAPHDHKHLTNTGHNAVYINRAVNCFVSDLEIRAAENGINLAATKNVTVSDVSFTGDPELHHVLACRVNSADNLFEYFTVDGPFRVKHGINTEWLSSGNVWRKGTLKKSTFDSHRALSFDSIRTDITLANDADGPGGDGAAGPFLGKRIVHWNIRLEKSPRATPGEFINQPELLPMGALVGIQGAPLVPGTNKLTAPGDKNCLVADPGKSPSIPDLFEAQLKLRLGK